MVERDFDVDKSLPYLIVRVGHVLSRGFAEQMEKVGLSARQFAILTRVGAADGIGSAELARAMGVTPQSTGEQLELMIEKGLLKRDPPRPGRKSGLHLTAKGRRRLTEGGRVAAAYEAHLTELLDDGERERFAAGLTEMARRV